MNNRENVQPENNISLLILEDREKRFYNTLDLVKKYNLPVVCGKLNYPGKNKNTPEANKAFEILIRAVKNKFGGEIIFEQELSGYDGRSILAAVNMNSHDAKKAAVDIEDNNVLGRVFDVDIYVENGESVGRENIGIEPRKCIICGDNARVCIRSGRHSLDEILNKVN
jgi:holo-ACP synthase